MRLKTIKSVVVKSLANGDMIIYVKYKKGIKLDLVERMGIADKLTKVINDATKTK